MSNPFAGTQPPRARFASPNPASPYLQPRAYPPQRYSLMSFDDGSSDVSYGGAGGGRGGASINGSQMPWVAGEDDDELKPLTG